MPSRSRGRQAFFERIVGPTNWGALSLPTPTLVAAGTSLVGRDLLALPHRMQIAPASLAIARLRQLHSDICEVGVASEVLAKAEARHSLEQSLIEAIVGCLVAPAQTEPSPAGHHHATILRRLHNVLERYPERPLYLPEICVAIHVSERTLRRACHEHFGIGPKQYLQLRRMHLARRALQAGVSPPSSVTEIATRFGFWHLDRFPAQYRAIFDETPPETLRTPSIA